MKHVLKKGCCPNIQCVCLCVCIIFKYFFYNTLPTNTLAEVMQNYTFILGKVHRYYTLILGSWLITGSLIFGREFFVGSLVILKYIYINNMDLFSCMFEFLTFVMYISNSIHTLYSLWT